MKICPRCNEANADAASYCAQCGDPIASVTPSRAPQIQSQDAQALRPQPYTTPTQTPKTSGLAIFSLICGCFFFIFPSAVLAVVLGHVSRKEIAKSANRIRGGGMALAGLILGYIGVALVPVILITIAISLIPHLTPQSVESNQISAIASLRKISTAAMVYSSKHGSYPPSLSAMGPSGAGLIDKELASGRRNGYAFAYVQRGMHRGQSTDAFEASADPIVQNRTGIFHYFVDETGVIRRRKGEAAGRDSPPLH